MESQTFSPYFKNTLLEGLLNSILEGSNSSSLGSVWITWGSVVEFSHERGSRKDFSVHIFQIWSVTFFSK